MFSAELQQLLCDSSLPNAVLMAQLQPRDGVSFKTAEAFIWKALTCFDQGIERDLRFVIGSLMALLLTSEERVEKDPFWPRTLGANLEHMCQLALKKGILHQDQVEPEQTSLYLVQN